MKNGFREKLLGLNPITSLYLCVCILAEVIVFNNLISSLAGFCLMILLSAMAGQSKKYLAGVLKPMSVLILMIFLLQALMYQGNSEILWHWRFISVKKAGVIYASELSAMLLNISGAFALLVTLTNIKKLVLVFEERGFNPKASYVVLSTFQIIPEMSKKLKVIMDAQRTRGVETDGNILIRIKAFLPILIPLVISSIVSLEERALMLEARAFTMDVKKTRLTEILDTKTDRLLRIIFVSIPALTLIGRIAIWLL